MRKLFQPILVIFMFLIFTVFAGLLQAQDAPPVFTIDLYKPGENPANQLAENSPKFQIDLFGGKVVVPALKGLTWAEASEKLDALNLKPEKKNEEGLSVDLVDYQNPRAGLEVEMGTAVGMRLVTKIPDVTGKPLGDAYAHLKDAGFKVKYFRDWGKDYDVTGQVPKSGRMDIRGKTITLQCNVAVPNVKGKTVEEAKKILEKSDIFASITTNYREDDLVLSQGYRPGKMIPRRFTMLLEPGVLVPDVSNVGIAAAELRLIAKGIPAKIVTLTKVGTINANEHGRTLVTAQSLRRGQYISRGNTLGLKVSQLVYQELRLPVVRFKPIDYGRGYEKPCNPPEQQAKCPECGNPVSRCRCYGGG